MVSKNDLVTSQGRKRDFYVCESELHCTATEMRVCDLLGSCLVGKWAFIPQLHNHQDIYSHIYEMRGWVVEEVK